MGETRVGLLEFGDLSLRDVIATAKLADDLGFSGSGSPNTSVRNVSRTACS